MHPLVLELTGKKTPQTGLESKFSVYFAAALAIVRGSAGMRDFSDENARDPVIVALRDRVVATIDPAVEGRAGAGAHHARRTAACSSQFVEHVVGSLERPMSDADLEAKFLDLVEGRAARRAGARADGPVLEGRGPAERGGTGGGGGAAGVTRPHRRSATGDHLAVAGVNRHRLDLTLAAS